MKGWFSKVMKFDSIEGHKWTSCHRNIFKKQQSVIDVTSSNPLQVLRSTIPTLIIDSMHEGLYILSFRPFIPSSTS
jgi:hypothetical protein